jgi:DNA-binding response OmpR family regulator
MTLHQKCGRTCFKPALTLQADDHDVAIAHTGEEAFYLIETECFDLIVLDVAGRNLPGPMTSCSYLKPVRRSTSTTSRCAD